MATSNKSRLLWVDAAKFLGIYYIWLGHMTYQIGLMWPFLCSFNLSFFFFLSGCTDYLSHETNFFRYTLSRIKRLYIPFLFFAALSILVKSVTANADAASVKQMIRDALLGAPRENYFAYQLWFLTALLIMSIIFFILKQIRNKAIIILIAAIPCVLLISGVWGLSTTTPFNFYYVMQQIIFYAVGYCAMPSISRLFELKTTKDKQFFALSIILTGLFAVAVYYYKDPINFFAGSMESKVGALLLRLLVPIRSLLLIYLALCIARLLQFASLFRRLGEDTLYLCGNEFVVKCLASLGLTKLYLSGHVLPFNITSGIGLYIYVFLLMLLTDLIIVPLEKVLLQPFNKH